MTFIINNVSSFLNKKLYDKLNDIIKDINIPEHITINKNIQIKYLEYKNNNKDIISVFYLLEYKFIIIDYDYKYDYRCLINNIGFIISYEHFEKYFLLFINQMSYIIETICKKDSLLKSIFINALFDEYNIFIYYYSSFTENNNIKIFNDNIVNLTTCSYNELIRLSTNITYEKFNITDVSNNDYIDFLSHKTYQINKLLWT